MSFTSYIGIIDLYVIGFVLCIKKIKLIKLIPNKHKPDNKYFTFLVKPRIKQNIQPT